MNTKKIIFGISLVMIIVIGLDFYQEKLLAQTKQQKNQQVIDEMLALYAKQGGKDFSAKRGAELWITDVKARGKVQNCTACHDRDITLAGKHRRTGKKIAPMAAWTVADRYTDKKKIKKWFKQNCNTTWGRDCTPQEKGDFLSFFRAPLK